LTQELEVLAIGQGIGLLALLVVIAGFGYWQYKSNFEQAEHLVSAFSDVQEGDFETDINLSSGDEWVKISTGFNQMVTELNERERAIKEREQRLEVLNRVLRHNLRNDMTVIINRTQLLPAVDDEQRQQDLADKVVETAEELLAHGEKARKIETAIDSAKKDNISIDVAPIISDLAHTYASKYPEIDIKTSLPDTFEVVAISSFEYAIENVIENACIHNDSDDPIVEINLEERQDELVCLSVTDNGPGIPEDEQELYRKGKQESALEHGSGVGLWLAYWIMEKSGGQLRFEDGIDTGTTVQLLFETPT
jgi:signal transduction histidine kinase